MTYSNLFKKVLFISALLFSCIALRAQVMWSVKGGIMPVYEQHDDEILNEHRLNWMAGLELEIPLSKKFNIETGLRYKNQCLCLTEHGTRNDVYEYDHINHLELPLRLAYKQNIGDYFSLHIGIGPYIGTSLESTTLMSDDMKISTLRVGIEPSIAINWKKLSLGVTYNSPCFYKGYKIKEWPIVNYKNNTGLMVTMGIRFGTESWDNVGKVLAAASSISAAVGTEYSAFDVDGLADSYYSNSGSDFSDNSKNNSSNVNYLEMYQRWERNAQNAYNSLAGKSGGSVVYLQKKKQLKEAQNEMKKWREKARKAGVNILQSEWETKTVRIQQQFLREDSWDSSPIRIIEPRVIGAGKRSFAIFKAKRITGTGSVDPHKIRNS